MKLYSVDLSPFAARVRLAIYAKNLPVEIVPPPGDLKSAEFKSINPIGKVPALALDDGVTLPESETIADYLADLFPDSGLKPSDPLAGARVRLIGRLAETYVMSSGGALFAQMNPRTRDEAAVAAALETLDRGLGVVEAFMQDTPYAAGESLTLADCGLVPVLFFVGVFGSVFGKGDLLASHPRLSAYWRSVQSDPHVSRVLKEMQEGLAKASRR